MFLVSLVTLIVTSTARMNTARTERDPNKDYSEDIYNALREAEVDFDCLDDEGNSPLHLGGFFCFQ